MNNSKTEIQSIAFLRGVACLFVALYHLKSSAPNDSIFYNLFKFGSFGVDLFFMISGFVIVIATMRDSKADSFLIKRLFRIYPPLIAAIVFQIYFNNKEISISEFFSAILPLHNDYTAKAPDFGFSFLIVAWSITFELAFYFVFLISMSISHCCRILICSFIILLIVIGSQTFFNDDVNLMHAWAAPSVPGDYSYLNFLRVFGCSIMLEFIVGMVLAYAYTNIRVENNVRNKKVLALFAALSAMYIIPSYLGGYNRGIGLAGYGLWSVLILTGCLIAEKMELVRWNTKMMFIGTVSYSLYLFHIPVHELIKSLNPSSFGEIKNAEIRAVCVMLFELSASVLVAYISYVLIEKPSVKAARVIINGLDRVQAKA
ncbi:acyltransferase [Enterobacter asburiae]|uniref:acyltransferase family protein n=1 Tax=Enterobacter asburiae TaxID=61645 RepID=UPI00288A7274|nr:acyltransferase [Enterobacter asburiae]WNI62699.1 acyltransferase [Enterobacter asburiae]WNI69068.1 acyltransferase [Enterobacter asburiae]